jgi:hypothetical protein
VGFTVFALPPGELLAFEPPADAIEFKADVQSAFGADKGGVIEGSAMELGRYVRCERLQQRRRFLSSDGKQAFCQDRLRTKHRRKLETEGCFVAHSHVSLLCKGNPMVLEPLCLPGDASTSGSASGADIAVCATPICDDN